MKIWLKDKKTNEVLNCIRCEELVGDAAGNICLIGKSGISIEFVNHEIFRLNNEYISDTRNHKTYQNSVI